MKKIFVLLSIFIWVDCLAFGRTLQELSAAQKDIFVEKGFLNLSETYDKEKLELMHSYKALDIALNALNFERRKNAKKDELTELLANDKVGDYYYPKKAERNMNLNFYNSTDKTIKRLEILFDNDTSVFDGLSDDELAEYPGTHYLYWEFKTNSENAKLTDREMWDKFLLKNKASIINKLKNNNKQISILLDVDIKPKSVGSVNFLLPTKRFIMQNWGVYKVWVE